MLWPAMLATSLAAPAAYLGALVALNGRQRAQEPPLVRGALPFLGMALPFGRDARALLERERARHGEVFTLFVGGQRMTFLADPMSLPAFLKAKQLRFSPIVDEVSDKAFEIPAIRAYEHIEALERSARDYLKGEHLGPLTTRMDAQLCELLPSFAARGEVDLYRFTWDLMFAAGARAVFGTGMDSPDLARAFETFDEAFPLMVAGAPKLLIKRGTEALEQLAQGMATMPEDTSGWVAQREALLTEMDPLLRGRLQSSVLWAAQANTIPAAYWAIAYLIAHPEAEAVVREELDQLMAGEGEAGDDALTPDRLGALRMLDSTIKEALRLSTGSLTLRRVMEDFVLETPGGNWALREGDRVCVAPFLTHYDPEIFPDPNTYRYDRFYIAQGVKQFHKGGQRVPIPLMPFGAGVSMCPGRFFALNEIKLFVARLLTQLDIERVEPSAPLPGFDHSRVGLGIYPPAGELRVRLKLR